MENELLENLGRLHTTELGVIRIKKNLSLNVENVIEWCKEKISLSNAEITRKDRKTHEKNCSFICCGILPALHRNESSTHICT